MKLIASTAEVLGALQEAKRGAPRFVTNLFPDPRKIEGWIARNELFGVARGRASILLQRDGDLQHVLFAAAEPAALVEGLRTLAVPETCVSDLIGRAAEIGELAACFEAAGFVRYKCLQRLVRLRTATDEFSDDPSVVYASSEEAGQIDEVLRSAFDRHAEQLPLLSEIREAAQRKNILVIRDGASLAGLLYFEPQGQAALVRYWFVSDACRGQGVGSRLMKTFFHRCPDARRVVLWVITTNDNAFTRYEHYGFKPDGLLDQVMIKFPAT